MFDVRPSFRLRRGYTAHAHSMQVAYCCAISHVCVRETAEPWIVEELSMAEQREIRLARRREQYRAQRIQGKHKLKL